MQLAATVEVVELLWEVMGAAVETQPLPSIQRMALTVDAEVTPVLMAEMVEPAPEETERKSLKQQVGSSQLQTLLVVKGPEVAVGQVALLTEAREAREAGEQWAVPQETTEATVLKALTREVRALQLMEQQEQSPQSDQ